MGYNIFFPTADFSALKKARYLVLLFAIYRPEVKIIINNYEINAKIKK